MSKKHASLNTKTNCFGNLTKCLIIQGWLNNYSTLSCHQQTRLIANWVLCGSLALSSNTTGFCGNNNIHLLIGPICPLLSFSLWLSAPSQHNKFLIRSFICKNNFLLFIYWSCYSWGLKQEMIHLKFLKPESLRSSTGHFFAVVSFLTVRSRHLLFTVKLQNCKSMFIWAWFLWSALQVILSFPPSSWFFSWSS